MITSLITDECENYFGFNRVSSSTKSKVIPSSVQKKALTPLMQETKVAQKNDYKENKKLTARDRYQEVMESNDNVQI